MDNNKEVRNRANEITGLRNHFTYIFEEAWKSVVAFVVFILFSDIATEIIKEIQVGNWVIVAIFSAVVAVIFLVILLFFVNRWRKTFISVKDGMLTIERKLVMHHRNEIAIENISNINLEQNIFEMIVGTYKLKLDTNSSSTANKTDVKIVLKSDMAYKVKNTIVEMMRESKSAQGVQHNVTGTGAVTDAVTDTAPAQDMVFAGAPDVMDDLAENDYDIIYDNKSIIRNCIAKTSVSSVLIVIAVFIGLGFQISDMLDKGNSLGSAILTSLIAIVLNISILRVIVSSWLNDFRFRVKRHKDKIYVSCGLLKRRKYAIPVNMINAVRIYTNFIGRLMKLYCVEIISVGGEEEEAQGKMVLLAETFDELRDKLSIILPEYEIPEIKKAKKMPKRVFWCRLIKGTVFIAAFAATVDFAQEYIYELIAGGQQSDFANMNRETFTIVCLLVVGGIAFLIYLISILSYSQRRIHLGKNDLVIMQGCFGKRILTIPYKKIQHINYSQGIIDNIMNVGKGCIFILATMAFKAHATGKYDINIYEELNEKLRETY